MTFIIYFSRYLRAVEKSRSRHRAAFVFPGKVSELLQFEKTYEGKLKLRTLSRNLYLCFPRIFQISSTFKFDNFPDLIQFQL